jgi:hypothetical protein
MSPSPKVSVYLYFVTLTLNLMVNRFSSLPENEYNARQDVEVEDSGAHIVSVYNNEIIKF